MKKTSLRMPVLIVTNIFYDPLKLITSHPYPIQSSVVYIVSESHYPHTLRRYVFFKHHRRLSFLLDMHNHFCEVFPNKIEYLLSISSRQFTTFIETDIRLLEFPGIKKSPNHKGFELSSIT